MMKLIIGNKVYSSWSLRGWLAVRQAGLPFEEVLVPLYDEHWATRKVQPDLAPSQGKVPLLWDGEIAIWDSLAIIDYLDAQTGRTLFWPADKAALAFARSISAEMHAGYQPLRQHCTMNTRHRLPYVDRGPEVAANVSRIVSLWQHARSSFGAGGGFLFGHSGAADIMFAPVVTRLETYSIPVPDDIRAYMDAVLEHPFLVDWFEGASAEDWVLPQFEPAGV